MSKSIKPATLDAAFQTVCQDLLEVFIKKHRDYGKGNILSIKELGMAFREAEKAERLKNLLLDPGKVPANETINDTWEDIGVYAIIALMYRRGWFQDLELKS